MVKIALGPGPQFGATKIYAPVGVLVAVGRGVFVAVLVGTGVNVGDGVAVGGTPTTMAVSLLLDKVGSTASKMSPMLLLTNAGLSVMVAKPSQA